MLATHVAIGEWAADVVDDFLGAGFGAWRAVKFLGLPAHAGPVVEIDAFEHGGPVVRFGAAVAGLNGDKAVAVVVRRREQGLELDLLHAADEIEKRLV